MAKIMVHVGLPKTGSSAIQDFLFYNDALLKNHAAVYPKKFIPAGEKKHQMIISELLNERVPDFGFLREIREKTVLFSTESIVNELYNISDQLWQGLVDELYRYGKLEVVAVDRSLDDWSVAYYKQAVVNQPSSRFSFYATSLNYEDFLSHWLVKRFCDRNRLFGDLAEIFRVEPTIVQYQKSNLLGDFCKTLGVDPGANAHTFQPVHQSLPDVAIEVLRQLNALVSSLAERNAWLNVLSESIQSSHVTLSRLAQRASATAVRKLDTAPLDKLCFSENRPLVYDVSEFDRLVTDMKKSLATAKQ